MAQDACDNERHTPLHYAAYLGHPEAVRLLVAAGADKLWRCRAMGDTALHLAARQGEVRAASAGGAVASEAPVPSAPASGAWACPAASYLSNVMLRPPC